LQQIQVVVLTAGEAQTQRTHRDESPHESSN
jgi:hypothetical protein